MLSKLRSTLLGLSCFLGRLPTEYLDVVSPNFQVTASITERI
jgi:hypothetical protein